MSTNIDLAALATAVVAVSIATINAKGPYDAVDLVIGLTLLILIFSYAYRGEKRDIPRRVAIASVVGLTMIPVVGAGYDLFFNAASVTYLSDVGHVIVWFVTGSVAFILDSVMGILSRILQKNPV